MGLFRLIIFGVAFFMLWKLFRLWQKHIEKQQSSQQKDDSGEAMVKCRQCHLHLPETQAIKYQDDYFCSQEHIEQFQDKQD